ncbi:3364_t:CDS:2 [Funneliformis caledonium]|uniref:3364_t:CDS:1 n=1 Tax=Funneliformis caledonium TaxID=1117310 RepID=A0A9N9FPZ9_9GLOM|nr:3364_t:CDS:2 [Funneliformis caledonium]
MVESDKAYENCKENFENDKLPKCDCERLKNRYTYDSNKWLARKEKTVKRESRYTLEVLEVVED